MTKLATRPSMNLTAVRQRGEAVRCLAIQLERISYRVPTAASVYAIR